MPRGCVLLFRVFLQVFQNLGRLFPIEHFLALFGDRLGGRVSEVVLEIGFANRAARSKDVQSVAGDSGGDQGDVGNHSDFLDRYFTRRQVFGDRQLEGGLVHLIEDLHRALAEGLPADDHRPIEVLQSAGDDLRGGCRPRVDEDDQRIGVVPFVRMSALFLAQLVRVPDGGDDRPLRKEQIGDLDRLLEQTPRVAAKIQYQPLHPAGFLRLLRQLGEGHLQVVGGIALEILEANVSDVL